MEARVADYLRTWGISDALLLQAHAQRWTRHELHELKGLQNSTRRVNSSELEHRVLSRAMNAAYLWVTRLTRHLERNGVVLSSGLVALRCRKLLAKCPQAFLRVNHLPSDFLAELRNAACPVVPHEVHQPMPEQPLGELAPALTPAFYAGRLAQLLAWATGRRRTAMETAL
ncbi:MAG: hypothetical protein QM775_02630 [Pirellulales bacterium]